MKNLFHSQSAKTQKQAHKFLFISVVNDEDPFASTNENENSGKQILDYIDPESPREIAVTSVAKKVSKHIFDKKPGIEPWGHSSD